MCSTIGFAYASPGWGVVPRYLFPSCRPAPYPSSFLILHPGSHVWCASNDEQPQHINTHDNTQRHTPSSLKTYPSKARFAHSSPFLCLINCIVRPWLQIYALVVRLPHVSIPQPIVDSHPCINVDLGYSQQWVVVEKTRPTTTWVKRRSGPEKKLQNKNY